MKFLAPLILAAFATAACAKEEPKKVDPQVTDAVTAPKKTENDNCVKKDKQGKCPPLPNSPRPTPKLPIPAK